MANVLRLHVMYGYTCDGSPLATASCAHTILRCTWLGVGLGLGLEVGVGLGLGVGVDGLTLHLEVSRLDVDGELQVLHLVLVLGVRGWRWG